MRARRALLCALALLAGQAHAALSAQLRAQWQERQAATQGPLAAANAVQAGSAPQAGSGALLDAELRAAAGPFNAALSLQHARLAGSAAQSRAALQEFYASGEALGWQFSVGRKLVAWDVGYAFRPNDVVAQEERRTLLSNLPRGRPLLQAEYFSAETAWSLVWVNPAPRQDAHFGDEQALALRVYQRRGALDLHGFARLGERTHESLGAAAAWVASDSLELHASWRYARRSEGWRSRSDTAALLPASPWQIVPLARRQQALLGAGWTGENRLSLTAEAWWDGNALSAAQWRDWAQRNAGLRAIASQLPATLQGAVAGNLAWQTQAFGNSSLRRRNVFVRLSWDRGGWQPALDLLYNPEDGGRIVTASLAWTGDRWRVDAGLRHWGGPAASVIAQLPQRRLAYLASSWSF
jgi:hypothetical protein